MILLPPKPNTCPACATSHEPELPHNLQSLYYQQRFRMRHGRWPTWADAAGHCTPHVVTLWRKAMELQQMVWSDPPDGEQPIADPPHDTMNEPVEEHDP
jgi:hypothetical protein